MGDASGGATGVRFWIVRLALVVLGVAGALAALELTLQVAAPLVRPGARPLDEGSGAGGDVAPLRILCVGDSHTYGIWVDPEDTYPARLRRKVRRWPGEVVVLNAGVPGMNSSQVRAALAPMLERFQPDVVLLMVGVADFWNLESFRAEEYRGWRWLIRGGGLWDRSRVVKLARLLSFNLRYGRDPLPAEAPVVEQTPFNWKIRSETAEIDVGIDMHFDDGLKDIQVYRRLLRRNLALIAATAQASGARLVLMTYPTDAGLYAATNEVYRQFGPENGLPLIDLGLALAHWGRPPLAEVAYFPDSHPRRAGYEAAARVIARDLPRWLPAR